MPVEGPTMRAPKALLIPVVALLLVASLTAQVRLLSPSQGQVLYPTRVVRIEWDNPTALPVDLRYSTDQGTTWMPIASALHTRSFEWQVPLLDTVGVLIQLQLMATAAPRVIAEYELPDSVRSAWWSGQSTGVIALSRRGILCRIEGALLPARGGYILGLDSSALMCPYPGARDAAVAAVARQLVVVSTLTGELIAVFGGEYTAPITALAAHPRLPLVAAGYADGTLRLWNVAEHRMLGIVLSQALGAVTAIAFHPDGELLAHSGADGVIIVEPWETLGSSTNRIWLRHADNLSKAYAVTALAFSPRGKYLASAGLDGTVRLWDYANWYAERVFGELGSTPQALAFSGDGSRLFGGSATGVLCQWSIGGGEQVHPPLQIGDAIVAIGAHPFNDTVFLATASGKLSYWTFERTPVASESVTVVVRYPFGLRIGSCRGAVGDTVSLPILLDRQYVVPLFEQGQFLARCRIVLPPSAALVGDRRLYADHPRRGMYDTLQVPLQFGGRDTVGMVLLQLLASTRAQEEIRLLAPEGITWERSVEAFVLERVENGEIVVDTLCRTQQQRVPTFTKHVEAFIAPNPANQTATLVFSAIEAGGYHIELESLARADASVLFRGELERGVHRIELNLSPYSSGAYRVVIYGPTVTAAVSLLVIR